METYDIVVEERRQEVFQIEAKSLEEALRIAERQYKNKEFIIGPEVSQVVIREDFNMETIYLTDITGTIGEWLDTGFDNEVPNEVIELLTKVYEFAVKEL